MVTFANKPLQRKLTIVMMITAVFALLITLISLLVLEFQEFNESLTREINSIAQITAGNSKAALEFDDPKAGSQTLSVLAGDPRILSAALYTGSGKLFTSYQSENHQVALPEQFNAVDSKLQKNSLIIVNPIIHQNRRIGTIYIEATNSEVYERLKHHALIALFISAVSVLIAYLLSRRLGDLISAPIVKLAQTAKQVSLLNNYSIRAEKESEDETGLLVDQFNLMLEEIERKNEALELRVKERTRALEESQDRLRNSERLASIGTLAAGVAHEIRNPLNSILLATQVATRYKKIDSNISDIFTTITNEAKRCATIIKNILIFAKAEKALRTSQDLNEVVKQGVAVAKSYLDSDDININLNLSAKPLYVVLNATEIEQVIINLINNAIESTPNKIDINIVTEAIDNLAVFYISDNGPGIKDEHLKHIFDPFFSTKRQKGNTGLGLSLSHGIIADHGGNMSVKSNTSGTTFMMEFPRNVQ